MIGMESIKRRQVKLDMGAICHVVMTNMLMLHIRSSIHNPMTMANFERKARWSFDFASKHPIDDNTPTLVLAYLLPARRSTQYFVIDNLEFC